MAVAKLTAKLTLLLALAFMAALALVKLYFRNSVITVLGVGSYSSETLLSEFGDACKVYI